MQDQPRFKNSVANPAPMEPDSSNRDEMIDFADFVPEFAFVVGKGLVPGTSDYQPNEFGNASLVMAGVPFSLRFGRDRGQVFVDAGSESAGWHKLENVLEFVDRTVTQQQIGEPPDPSIMATLLRHNWDKVTDLFADEHKVSELQAFGKQKAADLLSKIFRKPLS